MDGRAAAEEHKAAIRQAAAKQALRNGEISPESSSSFSSASAVPTENDDDVPNFACCPLDWRYTNLRYSLHPPTQP